MNESQSLTSIEISSIGMQSIDNSLKIDDFDNYSLQYIFKFLSLNEKLLVKELVCKRWQRCVRELMAREITSITFEEIKQLKWFSTESHINYDRTRNLDIRKYPKLSINSLPEISLKFANIKCIEFLKQSYVRFTIDSIISIVS